MTLPYLVSANARRPVSFSAYHPSFVRRCSTLSPQIPYSEDDSNSRTDATPPRTGPGPGLGIGEVGTGLIHPSTVSAFPAVPQSNSVPFRPAHRLAIQYFFLFILSAGRWARLGLATPSVALRRSGGRGLRTSALRKPVK